MKPEFKDICYNPNSIVWGQGNSAVGPRLIAAIQLREQTPEEDEAERADYEAAKKIYDSNINKGQRWAPRGKMATKAEVKITHINFETQLVSFKQDNMSAEDLNYGYKPAKGKMTINAMIRMCMSGELEFLD